ncbi:hypothetical protein AYK24_05445 [Thermoplasmatales archaeon SG8-52-4]|nr:MAG: hypothetical protein AYK24_05445 [Thermoplasmatales archaeon SG8-52-4]
MKKTILILGIIFLLISVGVASSVKNNSFKLFNLNNAPYEPINPNPSDGSIDTSICPINLSWDGGDPDGDNVTYNVFFGKECPPPLIATNLTNTWYQLSNLLGFATSYYWMIVAIDEYGLITSGPIWTFKTEENYPPYTPNNPFPEDGAIIYAEGIILTWEGGDPNECDTVFYDVYFGVTNPPTKKSSNQSATYFSSGELLLYKTYYWKIDAWGSGGLSVEGPIWNFTTGDWIPPTPPIIDGPKHGTIGVEYTYTFNSTYNDCIDFFYEVDWGDGTSESVSPTWPNPEEPGPGIANHSWNTKGTYIIRARVRDIWGYIGPWGELKVIMPRYKMFIDLLLFRFLDHFPLLHRLLDIWRHILL